MTLENFHLSGKTPETIDSLKIGSSGTAILKQHIRAREAQMLCPNQ